MEYFQGYYNRNILPDYNPEIIAEYLKYIREVVANEDIELYNYLLNWFAFFVQNPGQRTKKALVITGRDWDNKHTFGRILCRMLEPYSKQYVGIWNGCQMLVVFDEITLPKAKKLIIDDYVTVNEYCRPKRTVENVANLIIINDKIANRVKNDEDFIVLTISDKYLKNRTYPNDLLKKVGFNDWNCNKTDAGDVFLDNLLTFFLKRDLKGFDVIEFPKNESKS